MTFIQRIFQFLTGLRLASILLLLLMALTWFGTLEQVDHGLHATIHKYFTWKNFIVFPDITINGKLVPIPLPGAYWVSALLFINMLLGGVLKIRKGAKQIGVIIAHVGVLVMLLGGFVTHHFSQRGNMALYEGETSNFAQSYHDFVIEFAKLDGEGKVSEIHVVPTKVIDYVKRSSKRSRVVSLPQLDLAFTVSHYHKNCRPRMVGPIAAGDSPTVDGYALFAVALEKADEANYNGCVITLKDGTSIILFSGEYNPYILTHNGDQYAVSLKKSIWKMPFEVKLDDFNAEFFPTGKPKKFESYVTRIEQQLEEKVKIYMNHPMRYKGFTFFQASWGPQDGAPDRKLYSVFEVVKNPSDQWPLYSIIIISLGLVGHLGYMLGAYIIKQTKRKETK